MKTLKTLKRWYGWVALLGWCLPFAIPAAAMGVSLGIGQDLAGPWLGWLSLVTWIFASVWSFAVVPWLHSPYELGDDAGPPGGLIVRRWMTSSVVGIAFAAFPLTAITVLVYLMEYGPVYSLQWGPEEKKLSVIAAVVTACLGALFFTKRKFRRRLGEHYRRRTLCFGCGYSLRGLDDAACPECGWTAAEGSPSPRS